MVQDQEIPGIYTLDLEPERIFKQINTSILYGQHLGLKRGNFKKLLMDKDPKALKLKKIVDETMEYALAEDVFKPEAVFGFFKTHSKGDSIIFSSEKGESTLAFPRQDSSQGRCLSDFVSEERDITGLFCTTSGKGIKERVQDLNSSGEFVKAHTLYSIAAAMAETCAEMVHNHMDRVIKSQKERERSTRYSFGYSCCPDLNHQKTLFSLLDVEKNTGITLTDEMMMIPENSVSSMVIFNKNAHYFNV